MTAVWITAAIWIGLACVAGPFVGRVLKFGGRTPKKGDQQ